jgi:DNA/RNA non-specific endonuclease
MIGGIVSGVREVAVESVAIAEKVVVEGGKLATTAIKETVAATEKAVVETGKSVEKAAIAGTERGIAAVEHEASVGARLSQSALEGFHLDAKLAETESQKAGKAVCEWKGDATLSPNPDLLIEKGCSRVYHMDAEGRPRLMEAWITEKQSARDGKATQEVSASYNTLGPKESSPKVRDITFDGSHLLSLKHGGDNSPENLVALPSENNRASRDAYENTMRTTELKIDQCLKETPNVYMQIYIHSYMGDTRIPEDMTIHLYTASNEGQLTPVQGYEEFRVTPTRVH